ncbi:MAG: heteromeric transposase endonuclease subunit TnsA [Burkholderiaceae bacterium]
MPVRKIPKNYRNVTGIATSAIANGTAAFESTLERDFLIILEFDLNVKQFEVQPVQIDWRDSGGKSRRYTPDVLVEYRRDIAPAKYLRPMLCEVKYREDIRADWDKLRPKIRSGFKYAKQHGWRFKIFTEKEIRTPYLDNARFLLTYMRQEPNEAHTDLLLGRLSEMRETDPDSLIKAVFRDRWARAELLPALWNLIANRRIGTDLGLTLTMFSRIWNKDLVR